jgi:hypothetical protein
VKQQESWSLFSEPWMEFYGRNNSTFVWYPVAPVTMRITIVSDSEFRFGWLYALLFISVWTSSCIADWFIGLGIF